MLRPAGYDILCESRDPLDGSCSWTFKLQISQENSMPSGEPLKIDALPPEVCELIQQMCSVCVVELKFPERYPMDAPHVRFLPPVPRHPKITEEGFITPNGIKLSDEFSIDAVATCGDTEPINLYLATLSGPTLSFSISPDANMAHCAILLTELKHSTFTFPHNSLIFAGKHLTAAENLSKTLRELGIQEDSTLHVVTGSCAIPRAPRSGHANNFMYWGPAVMAVRVLQRVSDIVNGVVESFP